MHRSTLRQRRVRAHACMPRLFAELPSPASFAVDVAQPGAYIRLEGAKIDVFRGSMRLVVGKDGKVEVVEGEDFRPAVSRTRCVCWGAALSLAADVDSPAASWTDFHPHNELVADTKPPRKRIKFTSQPGHAAVRLSCAPDHANGIGSWGCHVSFMWTVSAAALQYCVHRYVGTGLWYSSVGIIDLVTISCWTSPLRGLAQRTDARAILSCKGRLWWIGLQPKLTKISQVVHD
eukprot:364699-Chlamydomonas_euryale.AAC.12